MYLKTNILIHQTYNPLIMNLYKYFKILVVLLSISLIFSPGYAYSGEKNENQDIHVRIITTADIHATVFPYDFVENEQTEGSMAHVKNLVDEQRADSKKNIILLDNGDILQGQPTGYYYSKVATGKEHLIARAMNYMDYDAATVGNHDIETGPGVYKSLVEKLNFPWLAANINDTESGTPFFEPYTIIEKEGVRIAVLGLITQSVPDWLPGKLWENLEFTDMYKTAKHYVSKIQENENPDAIIGLFHSGAGPELEYKPNRELPENASKYIAKYVPGFDIVFSAHEHQERNEIIINKDDKKVNLIAGLPYAQSVAIADIRFSKDTDGKLHLKHKEGQTISTENYTPSQDFLTNFENEKKAVLEYVNQPLGYFEKSIFSGNGFFGNSAFTDFIHRIQMKATSADISFAAPLSFDRQIDTGVIKMNDMFKLYPYENYLYVMELTGEEIKNYLEFSYGLWFDTMEGKGDNLLLFREDENGNFRLKNSFYNFDSAYGIEYTVDVSKPAGQRISIKSMNNGKAFIADKTYKAAINSYRGSGGGGHLTEGAGIKQSNLEERIVSVSENEMRNILVDYIKQKQELAPQKANNWKIIPESWVKKAAAREMKMLFQKE
ncbi:MAG: bifunctional metallophosphatase/5'-nucleotidase [Bacteroidota bacterium]